MKHILDEIKKERIRQDNKFGEQNNNPIEWIAILAEEFGEASKEALEHHFKYPYKNAHGEKQELTPGYDVVQYLRLKAYRKELIECAAVCVNAIQSLERNELKQKAK